MKLNFTKLEIEYDSDRYGNNILELLESINIISFQASIRSPYNGSDGYFCIGGTDPSTLTNAIASIIDHRKDKKGEK
jgi:hypothetical protein|tara:strand:+ start:39905 stop:40135 length:231 start_codon:yes stop_codon:yes gene_type:complete